MSFEGPWVSTGHCRSPRGDSAVSVVYPRVMSEDVAALALAVPHGEPVVVFVSPLGTPLDVVQDALSSALHEHGYEIEVLVRMRSSSGKTPMDPIKPRDSKPITLTLQQVLEGAERAERIVERWPEWKRELSPSTWSERGDRRGPKGDGDR